MSLEYFESKLSDDELKQAIEIVYRWTTASGHKHIIEYFENKLGKDGVKEAIKSDSYYAYQLVIFSLGCQLS